jgi:hypothetical protein
VTRRPPERCHARALAESNRGTRVVGIVLAVIGVVFLVAGIATYVTVSSTLRTRRSPSRTTPTTSPGSR